MNREKAEKLITTLAGEAEQYLDVDKYNDEFEAWRRKTLRYISRIFGDRSIQVRSIEELSYPEPASFPFDGIATIGKIRIPRTIKNFKATIASFTGDLELLEMVPPPYNSTPNTFLKVFISHASKDDLVGREVINLLQLIGVKHQQIFYTSSAGYGIPLGKDWVETLRSEVSNEGVVISLLSKNYFSSQICLLEMGATWVLSKLHIPVLIPPLTFKDINDVINSTQGFQILDRLRWSSLKRELEKLFDLEPLPEDKWESQRDSILARIEKLLPTE